MSRPSHSLTDLQSIYSLPYQHLLTLLTQARKKSGLTQIQLADSLGRPQAFVSKAESGERRLDMVEFVVLAEAIGLDSHAAIDDIAKLVIKHGILAESEH